MTRIKIEIVCEGGHEQTIILVGMTREWAEMYCGLLDGTSSFYVHPPDERSSIGECGICGKRIRAGIASFEEVRDDAAGDNGSQSG